ncbi:MAG: LysR family transcriptional regulator [Treponema sp.]|jgi:DNA-binding transcriptional LysR family regulator|nr:LysR family transcriptional regulator [Treponema sp.]
MTTEQLRYFDCIAESGSFSVTAGKCFISQSAVSKQIHALEWELGCKLFERRKSSIILTPQGNALSPALKEIFSNIEAVVAKGHQLQNQEARNIKLSNRRVRLRIAALPILGQYEITRTLSRFERQNPSVSIELEEQEENTILDSLEKTEYDICILYKEMLPPHRYQSYPIRTDELVLFVNEGNPLFSTEKVKLDTLANEPLMLMPAYTFVHQFSLQACKAGGFKPKLLTCARIETILSNVEAGRSSAFLMKSVENSFVTKHIKAISLEPNFTSVITAVPTEAGLKRRTVIKLIGGLGEVL